MCSAAVSRHLASDIPSSAPPEMPSKMETARTASQEEHRIHSVCQFCPLNALIHKRQQLPDSEGSTGFVLLHIHTQLLLIRYTPMCTHTSYKLMALFPAVFASQRKKKTHQNKNPNRLGRGEGALTPAAEGIKQGAELTIMR